MEAGCMQGLLNQGTLDEILFDKGMNFGFRRCPLTTVKISIFGAVCERMSRLLPDCRVSVVRGIRNLRSLELTQDGTFLVCFSVASNDETEDDPDIQDTDLETAQSLYKILQLIAFHEL